MKNNRDSHHGNHKRCAFTLVELLVVISIIGVLIGLLMPAVQAARESSRRSHCTNNIKQVGLAFHEYHVSMRHFPPGVAPSKEDGDPTGVAGFGWASFLLPHLQQSSLTKRLGLPTSQLHDLLKSESGRVYAQVPLEMFRCPSDVSTILNDKRPFAGTKYGDLHAAKSNYVGNHGTQFVTLAQKQSNFNVDSFGVLWPGSKCSEAHIPDGTSNTILVGERRFENDWAGVWIGVRNHDSTGDTGLRQVFGISDAKINSEGEEARRGFSSPHPGGALFVFADGHVEFLDEEIEFNQAGATSRIPAEREMMGLYQRLLRRNDGEVIIRR